MATVNPSVIYEPQTLTQEQKDQVLANIGAMKSFDGEPFTLAEKNKLSGIDSGAEVNVIESIKVNGTTQTVTNKTVDISVPEVDQTYNASSTNPQSGTAVAQAIAASGNVPTPVSTDDGKVLKAYEDPSTHAMGYKWDVADSGIPSATSADDGKVLGVTNQGQSLSWVNQPTVNDSTVSVKIGSASETAVGTLTTNQSAPSNIVIPMASATNDGSDNWTYVKGAMSGEDKRALDESVTKLGGIEAGAQVNIKPDWEAAAGDDAEILNKPTIPTVNDSTVSVKIENDSIAFDSFTTNAAADKTIAIPLATAPAGASAGNSGAITATDKAKLDNLTKTHVHMLKAVSDYGLPSTEEAPYGFWVLDMEKPNPSAPNNYGYDYASASEIIAGLNAGNIYGLYTYANSPTIARNQDTDLFVMARAQNQESVAGAEDGVRIWFYKLFAADDPLTLRTTSIYAPTPGSGDTFETGRMALFPYSLSPSTSAQNEYRLAAGLPQATQAGAGKFLGVNSSGAYELQMVEHVPGITSSDNGKVLTASYSGGVGTAAWASLGSGKKVHRIFYDENSAEDGDSYGYLQDLEGEFDSTTHSYPKVQADDLHDWMAEGQYIVLIISRITGTPTQESYQYGECLQPYYIDFGLDSLDEKYVDIEFIVVSANERCAKQAYVSTTTEESPNYARISLGPDLEPYQVFPLQLDLTYPLTSADAGKVLRAGWDSSHDGFGTIDWDTANEVPTVGSSDDGKVLKATYSGGTGSYSWETAPSSGEMNVINTVKVNNTALTPDANKAVNVEVPNIKLEGAASTLTPASNVVTIPNAIATGQTGASNGLMTAADKKTVSESVIYKANPSTGADALLAQRLYVVRSDQEIVNILNGGGAEGQGTILFRIG
jgi:hypothetical protein